MKNRPIAAENTDESSPGHVSPDWRRALRLLDQDLARRSGSSHTARVRRRRRPVRAVGDSGRSGATDDRARAAMRRYAAVAVTARLGLRRRWLASWPLCAALFGVMREHGIVAQNAAELFAAPKREQKLPRVLRAEDVAALLDRIPVSTPLDHRDRALFELAYACGLRAEELVNLDVGSIDFDAQELRVEGKGSKTRIVPIGDPRSRSRRYMERSAPGAGGREERAGAVRLEVRPALSTSDVRRRLKVWADGRRRGAGRRRRASARSTSFVCHPPAGRRCRSPLDPGDAGSRSLSTTQIYTRVESGA